MDTGAKVRYIGSNESLSGVTGTLKRPRIKDNGWFVVMDQPLPIALMLFADDDPRNHDLLLYPGEFEPV